MINAVRLIEKMRAYVASENASAADVRLPYVTSPPSGTSSNAGISPRRATVIERKSLAVRRRAMSFSGLWAAWKASPSTRLPVAVRRVVKSDVVW